MSRGIHISRIDAAGDRRSVDTTSGSGKGKGEATLSRSTSKAGSRLSSSDARASTEQAPPREEEEVVSQRWDL
jgi:hypothetical protein